MNVHGLAFTEGRPLSDHWSRAAHGHSNTFHGKDVRPDEPGHAATIAVQGAPSSATDGLAGEDRGPRGVIGLLLDGHFKGVADIRLRINFHEELTQLEAASVRSAAMESLTTLKETLGTRLDELVGSSALSDDQPAALADARATFNAHVDTAADAYGNGALTADELTARLESAFDSLSATLSTVLGVDPPAQAVDATSEEDSAVVAAEPADGGQATEAYVDALSETFESLLQGLKESLSGTLLPELSPPQGNGVAYQKFLAIYDDLRGVWMTPEEPPTAALDTIG